MKKTLIFSGGGSGGHVIPALTLIEKFSQVNELEIVYVGSYQGIEARLVQERGVRYKAISTGKLRRYFSWQNFLDLFRLLWGCGQGFFYLLRVKSQASDVLLFTTGGFVTVPIVFSAWLLRIPIFAHEQTARAGLANQIVARFADKIFISFEDSRAYFPREKTVFSGYPLRESCFSAPIPELKIAGRILDEARPILFVTGGGNGSALLNSLVRTYLNELTNRFMIVHQVGAREIEDFVPLASEFYLPLAFLGEEMIELMKRAQVIISRAGAGTVSELMAMNKRSILVPLKIAQKNEQYYNAMEAVKRLNSMIIEEDELTQLNLIKVIEDFLSEDQPLAHNPARVDGLRLLVKEISEELKIKA